MFLLTNLINNCFVQLKIKFECPILDAWSLCDRHSNKFICFYDFLIERSDISSFVISVCGILIAIAMINVKSALDAWWKLASIFSGGMLGLFLLGVFSKQKNTIGAIVGVIIGLGIILWLSLSDLLLSDEALGNQFHTYLTIVFGTSTIFLVGFLFGLLKNKKRQ